MAGSCTCQITADPRRMIRRGSAGDLRLPMSAIRIPEADPRLQLPGSDSAVPAAGESAPAGLPDRSRGFPGMSAVSGSRSADPVHTPTRYRQHLPTSVQQQKAGKTCQRIPAVSHGASGEQRLKSPEIRRKGPASRGSTGTVPALQRSAGNDPAPRGHPAPRGWQRSGDRDARTSDLG